MSTANPQSSETLRKEGNKRFLEGTNLALCRAIRQKRFEEALQLYSDASTLSQSADEASFVHKNIASTNFRLAQLDLQADGGPGPSAIFRAAFFVGQGIGAALEAVRKGQIARDATWIEGVLSLTLSSCQDFLAQLHHLETGDRFKALGKLAQVFGNGNRLGVEIQAAVELNLELAGLHFRTAVKTLEEVDRSKTYEKKKKMASSEEDEEDEDEDEDEDEEDEDDDEDEDEEGAKKQPVEDPFVCIRKTLYHLDSAHTPLELALSFARNRPEAIERVEELRSSVFFQRCLCESMRALLQGDKMLHELVKETEELNMDGIFLVVDKFKEAMILTQEVDLENEAVAHSRMGRIYAKVLKVPERGHQHHMKAIELAQGLWPKIFTSYKWYMESSAAIQEHRNQKQLEEQRERDKERQPYLEELKKELEELKKKADGSAQDLLAFIYLTHPPKNPENKMGSFETQGGKKTIQLSILHYHPDKQAAEHGMKWKVLCEEITKVLNVKYSQYKG